MPRALVILASLIVLAWTAAAPRAEQARRHMVAAASPLAAEAGLAILRQGGSAVDAAIAAQAVLTLVEPQSSGIGGGAFILHFDRSSGEVAAYDGRETAPAAATPNLFLDAAGAPLPFLAAAVGGRSVGVPGVLRMLEAAHRAHGRLPWNALFAPAIDLADRGFPISPRLAELIAADPALAASPAARLYFFHEDGRPKAAGTMLQNPELAAVLRRIAAEGADVLYGGEIAREIVAAVRAGSNPGRLSEADLAAYRPVRREALCRPYRAWRVCGMPPPTSGGVAVLQILGLLQRFDLAAMAPGSAEAVHLISEASRLSYADRDRYLADPDFVPVPVDGLLDPAYLAGRSRLIDPAASMGKAAAGEPRHAGRLAPQLSDELPSTSHVSVVDAAGNGLAMTTTIEAAFGSRVMVRGFLLNNQLTDFSFSPEADGQPVANRVEAGKRPRSSMAPVLVFDRDGRLLLTLGSPGGSRIIAYVAQAVIASLDWGLSPQAAFALPHHVNRNGPTELEQGTTVEDLVEPLRRLGHEVRLGVLESGLHGIRLGEDGMAGGADPRREGAAVGE